MTFMPAFDLFPQEGAIIGKIVVGYGELELDLAQCLVPLLGDITTMSRVMFRLRNESNRLAVADAMLKPYYERLDMAAFYDQAYGTFSRCKQIRNNHAHCHWTDSNGNLFFTIFEESATQRGNGSDISFYHVDLKLLQAQLALFENCQDWLFYLR